MVRGVLLGSLVLACFLTEAGAVRPSEQSISTSRQFIVYGTDLAVRGVICDFAERTKRELLLLLGQRDDWRTAIVINARYPQANVPELSRLNVDLGQTGFGLKLQMDLVIDRGVSRPKIRRELLRALLLEMMYRGQPQLPPGSVYAAPPDWLLDGIPSEDSDLSREKAGALLALPVFAGNAWPLDKFVTQRPELLDAAAQNLYRAYSFALVDLLSHAPDGPRRLMQFILDVPRSSNDPIAELRGHFPELFTHDDGHTTWQKQIARLAGEQPYQLLSGSETERRLDKTLRLKTSDSGRERTYELTQFQFFLKNKSAKNALAALGRDLGTLMTRANPIYARIIAEYAEIVALLQRGRTRDVPQRLEKLAASRKAISSQMREIDDYLNWFEATAAAGPSGRFADYMKAAERAAQPPRTKRDPISVYLDALETQFEDETATTR